MNDSIRIRLSWGLIAVAVIHAMLLAVLCLGLRPSPRPMAQPTWTPPPGTYDRPAISATPPQLLEQPANVNLAAQGEMKQQQCKDPATCPQPVASNPYNLKPGERLVPGSVRWSTPVVKAPAVPIITPASTPTMPAQSSSSRTPARPVQVLLFINSTNQSREILSWWDSDANLASLKAKAEYQVYTADNPLYRTRFASIVPPDQFPVVLIQDGSGGHIHAAGKSMIPMSAAELVSDIRKSYELYKQAKQGVMQETGAIKTTGYSWDDSISPELRLNSQPCGPDGCPPDQAGWRPGSRVFDRLFDGESSTNPIEALIWANALDIATFAVFALAFVLLIFILARRGAQ